MLRLIGSIGALLGDCERLELAERIEAAGRVLSYPSCVGYVAQVLTWLQIGDELGVAVAIDDRKLRPCGEDHGVDPSRLHGLADRVRFVLNDYRTPRDLRPMQLQATGWQALRCAASWPGWRHDLVSAVLDHREQVSSEKVRL
jgi:hypothetical protein